MPVSQEIQDVRQEKLVGTRPNPALEVVNKFREGEMPSNTQLLQVIDKAEGTLEQRKNDPNVTPRGEQMISHASQFLDSVAAGLEQKNADEKLQRVLNMGGSKTSGLYKNKKGTVSRDRMAGSIRSLGTTVIMLARSGEFRNSIIELLNIMDSIFETHVGEAPSQTMKKAARGEVSARSAVAEQASKTAATTKMLLDPEVDVHMDDSQRQALFSRLADVMRVFSSRTEFKNGIYSLLDIVDQLVSKGSSVAVKGQSSMSPETTQLQSDLKDVVEQFTGNKSIDPFLNSAQSFIKKVSRDVRMRSLLSELREWIEDVIDSPRLLENQEYQSSIQDMMLRTKTYSREYKYDQDMQKLTHEARVVLEEIKNDEVINNLRSSGSLLANDFTQVGPDNQRMLDLHALAEMKDIIAPIILDQLENVPVPRIEGSDPTYDYVVDNIVFSARDILPENIVLKSKTRSKIGVSSTVAEKPQACLKIGIKHITTQLRNIKFFFKRKSFPRITDEGTVDVDVKGKGASLKLWLYLDQLSTYPQFSAHSVQFFLKGFDLHFRKDTKHTFLLNTGTRFFRAPLEKRIEAAVTEKIEDIMDTILVRLNQYLTRANVRARESLRNNPVAKTLSSGVVPIGPKHPVQSSAPKVGGVAIKTIQEQPTSTKSLKELGYLPGGVGRSAISSDDLWKQKQLVFRRMGYKIGTPGGFAAPLDGDLYKWSSGGSMWNGPKIHLGGSTHVPLQREPYHASSVPQKSTLQGTGSQTYLYDTALSGQTAPQPTTLLGQGYNPNLSSDVYSAQRGISAGVGQDFSGLGSSNIGSSNIGSQGYSGLGSQGYSGLGSSGVSGQGVGSQGFSSLGSSGIPATTGSYGSGFGSQQPSSWTTQGQGLSGSGSRTLYARDWQGDSEPSDLSSNPLQASNKWEPMRGGGVSASSGLKGVMEDVRSSVVKDDVHRTQ